MERKFRKTRIGRVVSNKMDKTVAVAVESRRQHPQYKKMVKRIAKFKAHDEHNSCGMGDIVKIIETRPISRQKRWQVVEIISKGETAWIQPGEIDLETANNDSETDKA